MNRANCRSCDAEIIWATSPASGRALPLNATKMPMYWPANTHEAPPPRPGLSSRRQHGYLPKSDDEWQDVGLFYIVEDAALADVDPQDVREFYVSHFLTCPNASGHSKGKS